MEVSKEFVSMLVWGQVPDLQEVCVFCLVGRLRMCEAGRRRKDNMASGG